MSDTWSDMQALKSKRSNLREKLKRRKQETQQLLMGGSVTASPTASTSNPEAATATTSPVVAASSSTSTSVPSDASPSVSKVETPASTDSVIISSELIKTAEVRLLLELNDVTLNLPIDVTQVYETVSKQIDEEVPLTVIEDLIQKFSAQALISISTKDQAISPSESRYIIETVDHSKLTAVCNDLDIKDSDTRKRKRESEDKKEDDKPVASKQAKADLGDDLIESLLNKKSAVQKENTKLTEEIFDLINAPTAKEQSLVEKFRSQGGAQVKEFCNNGTKEECKKTTVGAMCDKLHFKKIIHKHTDESLGDCSFLNTCFHMDTCKYVHYEIDYPEQQAASVSRLNSVIKKTDDGQTILYPAQWVMCDLRFFDMSVLGKFSVVMADPPWDIHMELPYGTMSDDEMRKLNIPLLQDDGYIFLWVTGRAMELGRECLKIWGYDRVDEMIWVKTNQLQRIIRTGRTGHWFNHGKEHCLVGVKGNPININKGLDCDVIVAEVRATSHKPDEIYGIIERLAPGTRKIELFGRPHNIQPNWITLGNQTDGVKLLDPDVVKAFRKRYPDGNCLKPPSQQ